MATRLPEELRLTPADAARLVEHEILARFEIRALPASRRLRFVQLAASDEVVGGRLHDAHIAAVASSAGAKIVVTENRRHFTSLLRSGIRVLTAKELVAEAL